MYLSIPMETVGAISVLPAGRLIYCDVSEVTVCSDGKHTVVELLENAKKGKKVADLNKDGTVDEKDLSIAHKEYHKEKKAKKVAKKKEK